MKRTVLTVGSSLIVAIALVGGGLAMNADNKSSSGTQPVELTRERPEESKPSEKVESLKEPPKQEEKARLVKVKPGDTLSSIAKKEDTSYKRIFNANDQLEHPDDVVPGEELMIPDEKEDLPDRLSDVMAQIEAEEAAKAKKLAEAKNEAQQEQAEATPAAPAPERNQPAPQPRQSQPEPIKPSGNISTSVWDRLAGCESGGNWSVNTGNGYYGGLQFSLSSWRAVGGTGYPHQASKSEQIARAEKLQAIQGWGAWPACTTKLGIR